MSGRPDHRREHYTASEVAKLCEVDLKTIHNWADAGHIEGWRTPGRHLRFLRVNVVAFMKRNNYPIPKGLEPSAAEAS